MEKKIAHPQCTTKPSKNHIHRKSIKGYGNHKFTEVMVISKSLKSQTYRNAKILRDVEAPQVVHCTELLICSEKIEAFSSIFEL